MVRMKSCIRVVLRLSGLSLILVNLCRTLRAKNARGLLFLLGEPGGRMRPPPALGVEMPKEFLGLAPVRQRVEFWRGAVHESIVSLSQGQVCSQ